MCIRDRRSYSIEYSTIDERKAAEPDWLMVSGGTTFIDAENAPELGLYIKFGFEVVPDSGFFVDALGGVTFVKERFGYTLPDGQWKETPDGVDVNGMIGGGITYFINDGGTCIIASFDNRRGVSAGMGFRY